MQLLNELKQIVNALDAGNIDYAVCGGLAMAIYAMPRATLDIDIMIELDSLFQTKRIVEQLGFRFEAEPLSLHDGDIQIYRLSKIEEHSSETLILDLMIVTPAIKKSWQSRQNVHWEEGTLSVISPSGLIELKSMRGKGQDLDDIDYLRGIVDED